MHDVSPRSMSLSRYIRTEVGCEFVQGRIVTVYTARWRRQGNIVRGCFSPLDGDLKPDNEQTLSLLAEDNALVMS